MQEKKNVNKRRLDWVDYAKGLGIIFVVFGHVIKGLYTAKLVDPTFFYYAINFVYSFHMPLFFMLSGYFFLNSFLKRGTRYIIINKLETIIYPFVIWSIIQTFIEAKLSAYTNNHISMSALLTCLYMPRSQFWFLFALFFINILNVLFFNISKKYATIISLIVWVVYYNLPFTLVSFDKTFINLLYFNVGILLSQYTFCIDKIQNNWKLFILNVIIYSISLYLYFNYPQTEWYNEVFPQLSGSFIIIYIANIIANKSTLPYLKYMGVNSMVIYLLHLLVGNGVRIFMAKFLHIHNSTAHIITGTAFGLICPLLIYQLVIKTKYLKWLFVCPPFSKKKESF